MTPPAAGGVAMIQVVGDPAPLASCLRSRRPIDLATMTPHELRVCRWVDGAETLDDVVVASRPGPDGGRIVDLCLHGGPRIIQRVLLQLARGGVHIVSAEDLLRQLSRSGDPIESRAVQAMLRVQTKPVALWLARNARQLPALLRELNTLIASHTWVEARSLAADLLARAPTAQRLMAGVRVVLTGEPNAGKSSLANALAEREQAIVHDTPGTTRDWVEHVTAVGGAPFVLIDTAGTRTTDDPIEQEAIRRATAQAETADIVVHVIDGAVPPSRATRELAASAVAPAVPRDGASADPGPARLLFWNKQDQPLHPEHAGLIRQAGARGLTGSATAGTGIGLLRDRLLRIADLEGWQQMAPAPFSDDQCAAVRDALAALTAPVPDARTALAALEPLLRPSLGPEDRT